MTTIPRIHAQRQQLFDEKQAMQIRLQPLLDKVEFATSPEIIELDNRFRTRGLRSSTSASRRPRRTPI